MGKKDKTRCILLIILGVFIIFSTLLSSEELDKNDIQKYFEQATEYRENSEFEKSREVYTKIIKIDPTNYEAHKNMGNSYLAIKRYDKAIEFYQKSIKINPKKFNAYHNSGLVYLYQKNYDKALSFFKKSLKLNSKFHVTYLYMGRIYKTRKEYDKAIIYFEKAIELNPRDTRTYMYLIDIYNEILEFDKALQFCYKTIEIDSENNTIYIVMGDIYHYKKELDLSIEFYEKSLKINSDSKEVQDKIANVKLEKESYLEITRGAEYTNRGEYEKAIESYKKSIDINPRSSESYFQIGRVYLLMGEHNKAREFFADSLTISPSYGAYFKMGSSYLQEEKYDESIKYYTMALEKGLTYLENNDSDIGNVYNNMGSVWLGKEEYDKALEFYNKALEIRVGIEGKKHVDTRNIYYNIGVTWDRKGKKIKAQEFYNKAYFSNKISHNIKEPIKEEEIKVEEDKEFISFILGLLLLGLSLLFHSKQKRVALISKSNSIKEVPFLFSWSMLLFAFFVPLMRKDYLWLFITLISYPFGGSIIISFLYNKIYIKNLIKKGYRPADIESENLLNSKGIRFYLKDYNEIFKKEENIEVQQMIKNPLKKELSKVNRFTTCRNCSASQVVIEDGIYVCQYCGRSIGSV